MSACEDQAVSTPVDQVDPDIAEMESAVAAPSRTSGRTLALVGALVAVAAMLVLPVRSWIAQQAGLAELSSEISAAEQRVTDLEAQREQWKDEPYVEQQARLRLNMVRPGEMGLIALDPEFQRDVAKTSVDEPRTWYDRLWQSSENPTRDEPDTDSTTNDGGE